jgi:predicted Rossmann-fold nucleotide-binding protein
MAYGTPKQLYTSEDLLKGYEPDDPMAFTRSWDFLMYRSYVADGGATPKALDIRRAQADHDACIADALKRLLDQDRPKLVGIMGGHGLTRVDPAYAAVARLGRHLTDKGYLIVTGGGPGAMEAAHLGALYVNGTEQAFEQALTIIKSQPLLPKLNDIVTASGDIARGREADIEAARKWMNAALEVKEGAPTIAGVSLAIPTWLYGQEPSIPFATHYAKYFQNSIREEALITHSRAGIVYAQGGGGTLREVFEDAEQNYYAASARDFTPMIFFDSDGFWEHDAEFDSSGGVSRRGIKIDDLIVRMFRYARRDSAECLKKIKFTTAFKEIDDVLRAHAPIAKENLEFALAGAPLNIGLGAFNRDEVIV